MVQLLHLSSRSKLARRVPRQTPLSAFKSTSFRRSGGGYENARQIDAGRKAIRYLGRLRDADDRSVREKEGLARLQAEMNVSILAPMPLRMTIGDESQIWLITSAFAGLPSTGPVSRVASVRRRFARLVFGFRAPGGNIVRCLLSRISQRAGPLIDVWNAG
jgi:hypothetical protein